MIKVILFDFSRVLLQIITKPAAESLNGYHREMKDSNGYRILDHFAFNEPLIEFVSKYQGQFDFYIYTTGSIQEEPELQERIRPLFKKVFTVSEIGYDKTDPDGYRYLAEQFKVTEEQIVFIDDTLENIEAAKSAGLKTIHFQSNEQFLKEIKQVI